MGAAGTGRLRRQPTSLRLTPKLLDRAAALVEPLAALPAHAAARMDRAEVLRIAIARGLHSLEREVGAARAAGPSRAAGEAPGAQAGDATAADESDDQV